MIQSQLNIEFWNKLKEKYPAEMEHFCKWVDDYKKVIYWQSIFREHETVLSGRVVCFSKAPKYHDLPDAMQIGIFLWYVDKNFNTGVINWWTLGEKPMSAENIELTFEYINKINNRNNSRTNG